MNVYVVVYTTQSGTSPIQGNPIDWSRQYSKCLMQELSLGTEYHGYINGTVAPYLKWQPYQTSSGDSIHIINTSPPDYCGVPPCSAYQRAADFSGMFNDILTNFGDDICSKIIDGSIQEVWFWSDDYGNFPEHLATGPYYTEGNLSGYKLPDCGNQEQFAVMGLNFKPNVPLSNAMEAYGHRLERAFDELFPCEFKVDAWIDAPGVGQPAHTSPCASHQGYTARAFNISDISQCGMAHWPPNVTQDGELSIPGIEYDGYQQTNLLLATNCGSWDPNPNHNISVTPVRGNCTTVGAWNCTGNHEVDKISFHKWWMQNLPGAGHSVLRCDGSSMSNWWDYLRGDIANLPPQNCNPNGSPTPQAAVRGLAQIGPLAGAVVTVYSLEPGGILLPIDLGETIYTIADGSYQTPPLPAEVTGKALVIKATGGKFVDPATGKTVSFAGHSLYSAIPAVDFINPSGGVITPFTDIAFRLTRSAMNTDRSLSPSQKVNYYNFWISIAFHLGNVEGSPIRLEQVQSTSLYSREFLTINNIANTPYAMALAGISQQALDAGISPTEWIAQLSADADDGVLDAAAANSAQFISTAVDEFKISQP
jgi:hypothetical protein